MATYYVATTSNNGSDSNDGTSSSTPWLTIGKANTSATNGDTIYLIGHATEYIPFAEVYFTKGFIFKAYNKTEAREWTKGDTYPKPKIGNAILSGNYGFYIQTSASLLFEFHNVWFNNLSTRWLLTYELNGQSLGSRWKLYNCDFSGITLNGGGSLFLSSTSATTAEDPGFWLIDCKIWDIKCDNSTERIITASYVGYNRMDNCTVYLKDQGAANTLGYFWYLQQGGSGRVVINDSIIRSERAFQFTYSDSSASDTYLNVNGLAMSGIHTTYCPNLPARVDITADPEFVSPGSNPPNFNLNPTSPCLGTIV